MKGALTGTLLVVAMLVAAPFLLRAYLEWRDQKVLAFCESISIGEPVTALRERAESAGLDTLTYPSMPGGLSVGMNPALEAGNYCCLGQANGVVQSSDVCSSG